MPVYWFKRLVGSLLMPFPVALGLMSLGLLLIWRKRRGGRVVALAGFAVLIVTSSQGIGNWAVHSLESKFPPLKSAPADAPAFIAVLGNAHSPVLEQSATSRLNFLSQPRLVEAVRLARIVPHATLLLCGADSKTHGAHPDVLAQAAVELGIAGARLERIGPVYDTHDEILALRDRVGDESLILVTTAWHMPRALAMARRAGLNATPAPVGYEVPYSGGRPLAWFSFGPDGLERSTIAAREYLGLLWARLRGLI